MADISLSIEGGEAKSLPQGATAAEAVKALCSKKIRKKTVALKIGDRRLDLSTALENDAVVVPITIDTPEGLAILRHSAAHIMAQAVIDIFGSEVQVTIGPSVADGFYYDFDKEESFSTDDFEKIEAKMQEIVSAHQPFSRKEVSKAEALELFKEKNQKYKIELIEDLESDTVSLYEQVEADFLYIAD